VKGGNDMQEYDNNFSNIEDFMDCLSRGCEVEFIYKNRIYSITHDQKKIIVYEVNNESSEKEYDDSIAALKYQIDDKFLADILSEMKITFRTF